MRLLALQHQVGLPTNEIAVFDQLVKIGLVVGKDSTDQPLLADALGLGDLGYSVASQAFGLNLGRVPAQHLLHGRCGPLGGLPLGTGA
ncbi:MAG: hypothetical protein ACYC4L_01615 [Chloroflexota bacterium]